MAVNVNPENLGDGNSDYKKEEKVIPKGFNVCRLVSYIEMGHHNPIFQGKHKVYSDKAKKAGQPMPPEMILHCIFEFPAAEYTGDFPLTVKTSVPWKGGEFINKLNVPVGIEEGWSARKDYNKSWYGKLVLALRDATGIDSWFIGDFVGKPLGCTIDHNLGKKADDEGNIPVYANMKLDSIVPAEMKHPMTQKVEVLDVPETIGTYCEVFDWDAPTMETWALVPKYIKKAIKSAEDFPGSALDMMLAEYTEDNSQAANGEDHKADPDPNVEDDIPV